MESAHYHQDLALLHWQIELGVTETICDAPVNRYDLPGTPEKPVSVAAAVGKGPVAQQEADVVGEATRSAAAAPSLETLRAAITAFPHCELQKGARSFVAAEGAPEARVMVIGEAPNRDEDRAGKPFVGAAGQLLDRMLAAVDMGRNHADTPVYVTNCLPWRPPQDRDPTPEEIAMLRPFLLRQIALVKPQAIVVMGNGACQMVLGRRGITRLRGEWAKVSGVPVLPMFHPGYLLRNPEAKRDTWADLLSLKQRLRNG